MLRVDGLHKSYASAHGPRRVLRGVDVEFPASACTAVIGHNGSGKSTLLRCLVGLLRPDTGEVTFRGARVTPGLGLGIVFDGPRPLYPRLRVMEVVDYLLALLGRKSPTSLADARRVLEVLGVADFDAQLQQLSRGTQQKVAIAVALAGNPAIIVCDEPTSFLDAEASQRIAQELRRAATAGACVVMATHDPALISNTGATRVLLQAGRIVADAGAARGIESGRYRVQFRDQSACDVACATAGEYLHARLDPVRCVVEGRGMALLAAGFPDSSIAAVEAESWEVGA
ncbi:ABC transporter ATP-binding protein [Pseudoxanthomonas mexicana]